MGKFVTMTEIANRLGISHSTVSRALADNPRISAKTRKDVKDLAEELGYQANPLVTQLKKGQSRIIGIIVPDLSIHFFAKVIESIQKTLVEAGYSILLFNTSESISKEQKAVQACLMHRVDGVLAAISMQTKAFDHFERILKHEIPLVFFDRVANFLPVPKVVANDHKAAYNATKYLLESGCKCIAHITGSINLNNSNNRLYGYLDALNDHDIVTNESLIHYYEFEPASINKFIRKTISKHPEMDGLFVFNDYVANYAINVITQMDKKIPEDIAVIGFSDEPVATYMTPQLSSVRQVSSEMGNLTAEKIISIIKQDEVMINEKIVITPDLVLRDTTK
ncbi:MAG: LacI family DNA-binding transcriptional regulator [Bacteroidota bacterium]